MRALQGIGRLYRCLPEGGQSAVHPIDDAVLVWDGPLVEWVGRRTELPARFGGLPMEDAGGRLLIPGLVDCHTHLAFAGWRADEFEQKLRGVGYLEIARAGGGILSTVAKTRATPSELLADRCLGFLTQMRTLGVTAVEVKTGYGLSLEHELRTLEVYRQVAAQVPQTIVPTLLAAHTVPPEYRDRRDRYVDVVVNEIIPAVAERKLASFCDVFVEDTAFSVAEGERILRAGKAAGMGAKLHADQITSCGGAELAAKVAAVSADHLEKISSAGIAAMAVAGVVAVSLPIASLYLNQAPLKARHLIDAGVLVAVATDFNPGSAPSFDLPLAMMLACTMQRMTPAEVLKGATQIAARAIGLETVGSLAPGKRADFALIEAESIEHWLYHFRPNACARTVVAGQG